MRRLKKLARWAALGLAVLVVAGLVVRQYVVRAVILREVRKQYGGRVELGDWWLNWDSAGVTGVRLGESPAADSPTWLSVDRITTDVSLRRLLRGQFLPTRVVVEHPVVDLKFDAKGKLLTRIPIPESPQKDPSKSGPSAPLPTIVAEGAEATVAQEGRPPLKIRNARGELVAKEGREELTATTDDPTWGRMAVTGSFAPTFGEGTVEVKTPPGFVVNMDSVRAIPFIPGEVWENLRASGPVDADVKIRYDLKDPQLAHVLTRLKLNGADATLVPLQVDTRQTTGEITIDDAKVTVRDVRGTAIDGSIRAGGTLDFGQDPPNLAVDLRLRGIDVTRTPAAWQLDKLGATGTLTGKVGLQARLGADGIDLTGTTGRAVIEDGSLQGIPIKELAVNLKAEGGDFRFDTAANQPVDRAALESAPAVPEPDATPRAALANRPDKGRGPAAPGGGKKPAGPSIEESLRPALAYLPLVRVLTGDEGFLGWIAFAVSEVAEARTHTSTTPPTSRLRLPKSITTRVELEDVDLRTLLEKAEKFGIKPGFPVAGRLSIKATATIPLAALTDIKGYVLHGDATLRQASIDHVDLGEVVAHLDVEDGVVNLSDFRGTLLDRPADAESATTVAARAPTWAGELPDNGFRARLRAEVEPRGRATALVEANHLPLGELFAPFLPVPTPLSGNLSTRAEVEVDLKALRDPRAYRLSGNFESTRIAYNGSRLDRVASRFAVRDGRATVEELSARLAGQPLALSASLGLAPPYAFEGSGRVDGWEIADVLAFVPNLPQDAPTAAGRLDGHAQAAGTLFPFSLQTAGGARLASARINAVPIRYVVLGWETERGEVRLNGLEAAAFGGKLTGDARIPTKLGGTDPVDVNLVLKGVDTRQVTAALPSRSVAVSGVADGRAHLTMPLDASTVDADVQLTAPDLRFRPEGRYGEGVRVESLRMQARAANRKVTYQASAEALGAKLLFTGSMPIEAQPLKGTIEAEAKAVGFRLGEAWRGLGMNGGVAELDGTGAVDANLRATVDPPQLWSRSLFELRDLRYGPRLPIGGLRGQVATSPTSFKVEQLEGTMFGGVTTGSLEGTLRNGGIGPSTFGFRVDRAAVPKLLAMTPDLARGSSGFGSVRVTGRLDEALHLTASVEVPRAQILNLTLSNVRIPADVDVSPASGVGTAHARRWTARLAGGSVEGNAWMRLGTDKSFQSDLRLAGVDLEVLSRIGAISSKASSGKLSGNITLAGPDPAEVARARGRFNFDLDDATLVSLPVFRELDRFLGAARGGGLFEDGDIRGNIANETVYVESMTLNGRVVQLHATGSVTFAGNLNMGVLVNTNQIIPQSGLALLGVVPGLGEAVGSTEKVVLRLASFLSSRLLKFRVTGTVQNPVVRLDPGVDVGTDAAGFFAGALKVPGS